MINRITRIAGMLTILLIGVPLLAIALGYFGAMGFAVFMEQHYGAIQFEPREDTRDGRHLINRSFDCNRNLHIDA